MLRLSDHLKVSRSGGMVYTQDLKSCGLWPCGFESHLRHNMLHSRDLLSRKIIFFSALLLIAGALIFFTIQKLDKKSLTTKLQKSTNQLVSSSPAPEKKLKLGVAVLPSFLDDPRYKKVITENSFSSITPENHMKMTFIQPSQDVYYFGSADKIMTFASETNLNVRGHTLVWYRSVPSWVTNSMTKQQASTILEDHIKTVVGRYKGKIKQWDVVNEALEDDGSLRKSTWYNLIGEEYIPLAFKWAHEADPEAKLFYNDYDAEGTNAKSKAQYQLIKSLKSQGVPIHGVGLQMHIKLSGYPTSDEVKSNLKRLGELGLVTEITEMDVEIDEDPASLTKLNQQADRYKSIISLCLEEKSCQQVTVWGVSDINTWLTKDGPDAPLLFDKNYNPKPAYSAIQDYFSK